MYERASRIAIAIGFAQWVARGESPIALAAMLLESDANGCIQFLVPMGVDQLIEVFQRQAGERHFLCHATCRLEPFWLTVNRVFVRRAAVAALRRAGDEQRSQDFDSFRWIRA